MSKHSGVFILPALAVLILSACSGTSAATPTVTPSPQPEPVSGTPRPTLPPLVPSIGASDQKLGSGGLVTLTNVTALSTGWVSVHADSNGRLGTVLGYTAVKRGRRSKLTVKITDASRLTPTVWAVLRVDLGRIGWFEFPGADVPLKDLSGKPVQVSFKVTR